MSFNRTLCESDIFLYGEVLSDHDRKHLDQILLDCYDAREETIDVESGFSRLKKRVSNKFEPIRSYCSRRAENFRNSYPKISRYLGTAKKLIVLLPIAGAMATAGCLNEDNGEDDRPEVYNVEASAFTSDFANLKINLTGETDANPGTGSFRYYKLDVDFISNYDSELLSAINGISPELKERMQLEFGKNVLKNNAIKSSEYNIIYSSDDEGFEDYKINVTLSPRLLLIPGDYFVKLVLQELDTTREDCDYGKGEGHCYNFSKPVKVPLEVPNLDPYFIFNYFNETGDPNLKQRHMSIKNFDLPFRGFFKIYKEDDNGTTEIINQTFEDIFNKLQFISSFPESYVPNFVVEDYTVNVSKYGSGTYHYEAHFEELFGKTFLFERSEYLREEE